LIFDIIYYLAIIIYNWNTYTTMVAGFQPLGSVTIDPTVLASLSGANNVSGIYLDADPDYSSVLVQTNTTNAIYIDRYQNVGINTTSPDSQMVINSASGNCLQFRYNDNTAQKGNIAMTSDGKLTLTASGGEINILSSTNFNILAHDGSSSGLLLNNTLVLSTAVQLNYNTVTPGIASVSKSLVLDSIGNISGINGISANSLTGTLQTASQPNLTSLGTLTGLNMNGYITGLTQLSINTTVGGRTLVLNDSNGHCLQLTYNNNSGSATTYVDMLVNNGGNLLITSSGGSVDITTHNSGTVGLKLAGVLIQSSANEINYLSGSSPGIAVAGKALIMDSSRNISNINALTATSIYGIIQTASQPYITSVNTLNISNHNGSTQGLYLGGVLVTATASQINSIFSGGGGSGGGSFGSLTISGNLVLSGADQSSVGLVIDSTLVKSSGTELNYLSGVSPGYSYANHALVTDGNNNISNINEFSAESMAAPYIYGSIQWANQPSITSLGNLTKLVVNGSVANLLFDNWTSQTSIASNKWSAIAYSPSLKIFLAVANNASGTVLARSSDGLTWTSLSSLPSGYAYNDIIWIEDQKIFITFTYTAGNQIIQILWSTDSGTSWSNASIGIGNRISSIGYVKDLMQLYFTATDPIMNNNQIYYLNNSAFVNAVQVNFNYTSTQNYFPINKIIYSSAYNYWYALEYSNSGSTTVHVEYTSTISNWSTSTTATITGFSTAKQFKCICEGPEISTLVAVATDLSSATGSVIYSTNGTSWTKANATSASAWFKVIWISELGMFVAISSDSTPAIMTSTDGINWTAISVISGLTALTDIKWIPEISAIALVSGVSGSSKAITYSYFNSATSIEYLVNPNFSSVSSSVRASPILTTDMGLNGSCRWLTTNSLNSSTEIMRLGSGGLSINTAQLSTTALDLMPSFSKNNNKVLRFKTNTNGWNYDWTFSGSNGYLTTEFVGGLNYGFPTNSQIWSMNHCLKINGTTSSTSTTTGSLVVNGGVGISGSVNIGGGLATGISSNFSSYMGDTFYYPNDTNNAVGGAGFTPGYATYQSAWSPQLNMFVATTNSSTMLYSYNGYNWSTGDCGVSRGFQSIVWADSLGLFVSVANDANSYINQIVTSSNGISWTAQNGPTSNNNGRWTSICWSNFWRLLVAVSSYGSHYSYGVMTSSDGASWNIINHINTTSAQTQLEQVIWNPYLNQFIACGYGQLMVSTNGVSWNPYTAGTVNSQLHTVAYSQGLGAYFTTSYVGSAYYATSTNGTTWTNVTNATQGARYMVWIPSLNVFLAAGQQGWENDAWSSNGYTWNSLNKSGNAIDNQMQRWFTYSPELEMIIATRPGVTTSNQNIIMSQNISPTKIGFGTLNSMNRSNTYSLKINSNINFSSGYNAGHRFLNSNTLTGNSNNILGAFMPIAPNGSNITTLNNPGLGVGVYNPQATLDLQANAYNEVIRIRAPGAAGNTYYASLGISSGSYALTLQSSGQSAYALYVNGGGIYVNGNINTTGQITCISNTNQGFGYEAIGANGNLYTFWDNSNSRYVLGVRSYGATSLGLSANSTLSNVAISIDSGNNITVNNSINSSAQMTISRYGNGFIHNYSSCVLATYYDTTSSNMGIGTTSNHNFNLFCNGNFRTPALYLNANNNTVQINTSLTGAGGAFGNQVAVSGGVTATQDYSVWISSAGNGILAISTNGNNASNRWIGAQLSPLTKPSSVGFTGSSTGDAWIQSGYFQPTYTETYTFTINYTHFYYKIWIDGILVANNQSVNAGASTATFTVSCTANVRKSLYLQGIALATAGGSSLTINYASQSQTSIQVPFVNSDGCNNFIKTQPMSCPSLFTVYDMGTSSNSLLKAELLCDTSGNMNLKSSGLTTYVDSSNNFNIAGHNGSTLGLQLNGTLVTSSAIQLNYNNVTPGTAAASKSLVLDSSSNISAINNLTSTGILTTTNTTDSSSITTGSIITAGGVGIAKTLYVGTGIYGTLQTNAQPNITSVGTLTGLTSSAPITITDTSSGSLTVGGGMSVNGGILCYGSITLTPQNAGDFTVSPSQFISLYDNPIYFRGTNGSDKNHFLGYAGGTDQNGWYSGLGFGNPSTANDGPVLCGNKTVVIGNLQNDGVETICATFGDISDYRLTQFYGQTKILSTFDASSTNTGALVISGGVGINNSLYVGTGIYGTIETAYQPNITALGTIDGLNIATGEALTIGSTSASESDLAVITGITHGSASPNKALVLDVSSNISGITTLSANTLNAINLSGLIQDANQYLITSLGTLNGVTIATGGSFIMGSTTANESDLAVITGISHGTAAPNKALVLNGSNNINNINTLNATTLGGTLSTAAQPNISSVNVLNISNHNGSSMGLQLGGVLITASATEINYLDTTPGSAAASKAIVLDSSTNVSGINNLSATSLTGTIQTSSQPNITNVGALYGLSLATGSALTIGNTTITESDIVALVSVTHGNASADRVLILDSSSNIRNINGIHATSINLSQAINTTLPLEVGVTSYAYTGAYSYMNSTNSLGLASANVSAASSNWSLRCDGRALFTGEISITSDRRIKKNINKLSLDLAKEFIMTSNPVSFNWVTGDDQIDYGFIAQEVIANPNFKDLVNIVPHEGLEASVDEETGILNPANHKYTLSPGKITPLLVLTQKDVYKQLEEKDKKIQNLETRLARLEHLINQLNL
jgi:hypothetical protein